MSLRDIYCFVLLYKITVEISCDDNSSVSNNKQEFWVEPMYSGQKQGLVKFLPVQVARVRNQPTFLWDYVARILRIIKFYFSTCLSTMKS